MGTYNNSTVKLSISTPSRCWAAGVRRGSAIRDESILAQAESLLNPANRVAPSASSQEEASKQVGSGTFIVCEILVFITKQSKGQHTAHNNNNNNNNNNKSKELVQCQSTHWFYFGMS